jgi:peptidoglycan/LPS O-acetylase OafA/YrhL
VLKATVPFFNAHGTQWALGPVSIAISVGLSYLFYRFFEMKTERFRENLYRKSRPKSAGPEPDKEAGMQTTAPSPN